MSERSALQRKLASQAKVEKLLGAGASGQIEMSLSLASSPSFSGKDGGGGGGGSSSPTGSGGDQSRWSDTGSIDSEGRSASPLTAAGADWTAARARGRSTEDLVNYEEHADADRGSETFVNPMLEDGL